MTDPGRDTRLFSDQVAALHHEYGEALLAFLTGVLRDRALAEEVLQTVFHRALERGHTIRSDVRGWLFQVAWNEAILVRRKQARDRDCLRRAAWQRDIREAVPDTTDRPVLTAETVERVRRAIERLPEAQQQVVRLRIYENKTFAVIAAELNVPLGTVLTRMRLATERLQRALAEPSES